MTTRLKHPQNQLHREAIRWSMLWIAAVLAVLSLARWLQPGADSLLVLPGLGVALPQLCSFRRLLGLDCPGCGLTRSFVLAVRLRLGEAWAMHPVGTVLVIYLAASIPQRLWRVRCLAAGIATRSTMTWELSLVACLVAAAYVRWALALVLHQH